MTSVLDYLLVAAISVLKMSGAFFKTPQQCRRWNEFADKHKEAMDAVIGDQKDWYISIDELFTHPTYQGRGYASALVNTVVQMADDLHRPTWLISSTPENAVFYHTFGFDTVLEIELGEGDPDWKSSPLVVPVMVRQRKERIDEKYRF
ncbi:hypothetical protein BV25DRAFT_1821701 [Artomyces pyxidatus]|uniref:Uncharacterized protein n=1 Tax=Artomyces pyxidatus TaxID=48021 RepID=A0ACB8TAX6_9AGAM|nr:hypothetical protein BV25DRAFT_1821701 [Artomyces pyxidatus]